MYEGFDRARGPLHRDLLERPAQGEEEQEDGSLSPVAQERRARSRGDHQEVDVERPPEEIPDEVAGGAKAAEEVGRDVERDPEARLRAPTAGGGAGQPQHGATAGQRELEAARSKRLGERRAPLQAPGAPTRRRRT